MKFIKSTLAAAVLAASFSANAATVNFGDVTAESGFGFSNNGTGLFSDTMTFTLTTDKVVDAVLFSFSFSTPTNTINNFWATLSEANFGVIASMPITTNFMSGMTIAPAGDYSLTLSGDFGTYGTYDIDAVLAPVPEPSTLGLMFGGLGLVGLLAYRSRKA